MKQPCHIHFVGIGGISMSGLAEILLDAGYTISGSDAKESPITDRLTSLGATIHYGHDAKNITDDISYVVYTAAVKSDNPELVAAREKDLTCITRAVMLGRIMEKYKTAISVAGTHGKTTTTSMISEIMLAYECDPTILVGGMLHTIGGNLRIGHSDYLVTEACEYTNSFLSLISNTNVILNVREDHLDFFKDINDIRNSFKIFADKLDENGILIINSAIDDLSYFTSDLRCRYTTFGLDSKTSDYYPTNITYNQFACASFDLVSKTSVSGGNNREEGIIAHINLKVPGEHNLLNALAAFATCAAIHIPCETIVKGLENFSGTDRRFQYKGEFNGVTVIDDYAHHPDEIIATLTAARNYPHKNLWCVFQPHTYTRTKALMSEFATALSNADKIVLAKIYPARETDTLGISSEDLKKEIEKLGIENERKEVYYIPEFEEIEKFLSTKCINGDLLITMGAGNIVLVGENLIK
ncbi:MAG: UDP-N-acetylmuramate--L-alanine ligase [Lachnospiraceae bacterium]|nr:UDP-N-acetylmuramate--L-alanine ligase [Lachnospiraceae bacterium]